MPEAPRIAAERQCSEPITCEFFEHCNPPLPDDHILKLPRIHASEVSKLAALGIRSIHEIPENYPLTGRLRRACTSVQMGKPWFSPELKEELGRLKYPLYFADFETLSPAIPRFAGMRPYDHIPFQWSVHVQRRPGAAPCPCSPEAITLLPGTYRRASFPQLFEKFNHRRAIQFFMARLVAVGFQAVITCVVTRMPFAKLFGFRDHPVPTLKAIPYKPSPSRSVIKQDDFALGQFAFSRQPPPRHTDVGHFNF